MISARSRAPRARFGGPHGAIPAGQTYIFAIFVRFSRGLWINSSNRPLSVVRPTLSHMQPRTLHGGGTDPQRHAAEYATRRGVTFGYGLKSPWRRYGIDNPKRCKIPYIPHPALGLARHPLCAQRRTPSRRQRAHAHAFRSRFSDEDSKTGTGPGAGRCI